MTTKSKEVSQYVILTWYMTQLLWQKICLISHCNISAYLSPLVYHYEVEIRFKLSPAEVDSVFAGTVARLNSYLINFLCFVSTPSLTSLHHSSPFSSSQCRIKDLKISFRSLVVKYFYDVLDLWLNESSLKIFDQKYSKTCNTAKELKISTETEATLPCLETR